MPAFVPINLGLGNLDCKALCLFQQNPALKDSFSHAVVHLRTLECKQCWGAGSMLCSSLGRGQSLIAVLFHSQKPNAGECAGGELRASWEQKGLFFCFLMNCLGDKVPGSGLQESKQWSLMADFGI